MVGTSGDHMTPTELILHWRFRVHRMQLAHYQSARVLEKRHLWLGLPAIALSTIVGTTVFASLKQTAEQSTIPWLQIAIGLLSVVSAVLVSLQTFLRYAELTEKHRMAGARFANLKHEIELIFTMPPNNEGNLREALATVEAKWSKLREDSPTVPEAIWKDIEKTLTPEEHAKRYAPLPKHGQQ